MTRTAVADKVVRHMPGRRGEYEAVGDRDLDRDRDLDTERRGMSGAVSASVS